MSLEIRLNRVDRVYRPGESVAGVVVVHSQSAGSHSGITLVTEGTVTLQLSARSVGLFEAFYSSLKPIQLMSYTIEVSPSGKLPAGSVEFPFEFRLRPFDGKQLFETYHGVYVNIQYMLSVDMARGMMSKSLKKTMEFIVELPPPVERPAPRPIPFEISPETLQNIKQSSRARIPDFLIKGHLDSDTFCVERPLTGELTIKRCNIDIKSVELQLVRVETTAYAEGEVREATEIQNIQLADGNVCFDLGIPIHMIFPRLFTCITTLTKNFKVEFEVNLIVLFQDGHMVTENFPIRLIR
eukprot:TRINITY_DN1930_c0_g1_i11.p1 TRINITY_DN1930_c0_g1~~TRINITY_DN1930_c0_g1_i11.p1  ORF type:complete len:325 (+),score=112.22 TRINITY_DN1930_c0_g1_i11:86-976(+)